MKSTLAAALCSLLVACSNVVVDAPDGSSTTGTGGSVATGQGGAGQGGAGEGGMGQGGAGAAMPAGVVVLEDFIPILGLNGVYLEAGKVGFDGVLT